MSNTHFSRARALRRPVHIAATTFVWAALLLLQAAPPTMAAGWNGIEPLKSRRADVERILGRPLPSSAGAAGTLRFKVAGGIVTLLFVDSRFVAAKKLQPELEGTVLQIVLQHERASDTPETLKLQSNSDFTSEDNNQGTVVFRNLKDGLFYTFVGGRLTTSRFGVGEAQLAGARK